MFLESLTNVIEPYRLRGGKPSESPAEFDDPRIQGNAALDVSTQQLQ